MIFFYRVKLVFGANADLIEDSGFYKLVSGLGTKDTTLDDIEEFFTGVKTDLIEEIKHNNRDLNQNKMRLVIQEFKQVL